MRRRRRFPRHVQQAIDAAVEVQDTRPRAAKIELILEYPPSLNNAYPTVIRDGRVVRVKSSAARRYEEAVHRTLGLWLNHHGQRPPLPPYRLSLRLFPPDDGRRHDASNAVKLPEDALMSGIGGDDDDVVDLHVVKERPDAWPRVVVTLEGEVS
jgi:Holliday junction resolvase RusA-like endonuclease